MPFPPTEPSSATSAAASPMKVKAEFAIVPSRAKSSSKRAVSASNATLKPSAERAAGLIVARSAPSET